MHYVHGAARSQLIEFAIEEARALSHNYVGTKHLLLGLLHAEGGPAVRVLTDLGLTLEKTREDVLKRLNHVSDIVENISQPPQRGAAWLDWRVAALVMAAILLGWILKSLSPFLLR
jgi:ATP-dependent Clp protease ATP-binding subunit ClpA